VVSFVVAGSGDGSCRWEQETAVFLGPAEGANWGLGGPWPV
jgi:hypothetical protein